MIRMKKNHNASILSMALLIIYLVFIAVSYNTVYAGDSDYKDIKGHWAEDYLSDLIDKSYIKGVKVKGELLVQPNRNITRAEFLTILMRTGDYEINPAGLVSFSDVKEKAWFKESIDKAASNGITGGYPDGTFKPNNQISRAEIASLIARIGQFELKETSETDTFKDIKSSKWYYNSVIMAKQNGIIGGYPDGSFKPDGKATRAEVATMIFNYLKHLKGDSTPSSTLETAVSTPTPTSKVISMPTSIVPGTEPDPTLPPELRGEPERDITKIYAYDIKGLNRSEILYSINYINLHDLGKFSVKITFDPSKLAVSNVFEGTAKDSKFIVANGNIDLSNAANGQIIISSNDNSDIAFTDGSLFIIKFKVLPDASGTTDIKISGIDTEKPEFYKINGDKIQDIEIQNGSITF
ncbi:S-layer homology domain-containing protein [Pseudobacteroides cellulosolvens]|uniref:S-layer domain-containing protein n=1 Tax=Pseudobacteroides cellulosolvens ATCC 35603 = DSM 2933 TaxID=398512 RepID=A0A0L6JJT3_9FIRM|nr:S-layer homology domain-containing protein [Pseudobacteroides cellulosolvens]KNY26141.1 S-layer domain-containing protein [Pseudobacteroides cellulosolvens ATCC 35603 = DSM 2933]